MKFHKDVCVLRSSLTWRRRGRLRGLRARSESFRQGRAGGLLPGLHGEPLQQELRLLSREVSQHEKDIKHLKALKTT